MLLYTHIWNTAYLEQNTEAVDSLRTTLGIWDIIVSSELESAGYKSDVI